jgi:hypothetical protein
MSPQTQITITHKNDLGAYFSDWKTQMGIIYITIEKRDSEESERYHITRIPQPIESFSFNSNDFSILLRYLDNRLRILEETPVTPIEFPYQAYAEARVFLKAFFIFLRILLDDLAGIIEHFYKTNERFYMKKERLGRIRGFKELFKKADKSKRTEDLSKLLRPRRSWFQELKKIRDDLVHNYDSILISFKQDGEGRNVLGHFNIKERTHYIHEDTRKYIALALSEYQKLIDDLLDHFDERFKDWYGIVQGKTSRTTTIIEDGITLWWAYKYGDYRDQALKVDERQENLG